MKILVLDDFGYHFPNDWEVIKEPGGLATAYHGSARGVVQLLSEHFKEPPDFVVIGNNLGAGLDKALGVPAELRDRTVVVWNNYQPGDERGYLRLGFSHFCSRPDLCGKIRELLARA